MKSRCNHKNTKDRPCQMDVDTLIERFKKMRALNCTDPHDVGLDGYLWKKFLCTTRAHLMAKMF